MWALSLWIICHNNLILNWFPFILMRLWPRIPCICMCCTTEYLTKISLKYDWRNTLMCQRSTWMCVRHVMSTVIIFTLNEMVIFATSVSFLCNSLFSINFFPLWYHSHFVCDMLCLLLSVNIKNEKKEI